MSASSDLRKALMALRLEVAPEIAEDVAKKIEAVLTGWQDHLSRRHHIACDWPFDIDVPEEVA